MRFPLNERQWDVLEAVAAGKVRRPPGAAGWYMDGQTRAVSQSVGKLTRELLVTEDPGAEGVLKPTKDGRMALMLRRRHARAA